MADLSHCQPNHLVRRAWWWRWGVLAGIVPLAIGLGAAVAPAAALLAVPVWWACRRAGALAYAGAAGEMAALRCLKGLPDDHVVFNQVRLPCPAARDGFLEADYVVVAPSRVAVVEVKHNAGEIRASVKDASWNVARYSKMATMRSPALQVSRHVAALGTWLRAHGAPGVWVEPAVFFSNPNASYRHNEQTAASNVSLVGPDELADYFAFRQPTDRRVDQNAVITALEALRSWETERAAGRLPAPDPSPASAPRPRRDVALKAVPSPGMAPELALASDFSSPSNSDANPVRRRARPR